MRVDEISWVSKPYPTDKIYWYALLPSKDGGTIDIGANIDRTLFQFYSAYGVYRDIDPLMLQCLLNEYGWRR